jgi:hypothetical protein
MRDALRQPESRWKIERRHGLHSRVVALVAAIGVKEPESSVIAQAVIHREIRAYAPGILRIKSQPLYVLGETAIAAEFRLVRRISQVSCQRPGIREIKTWIIRQSE